MIYNSHPSECGSGQYKDRLWPSVFIASSSDTVFRQEPDRRQFSAHTHTMHKQDWVHGTRAGPKAIFSTHTYNAQTGLGPRDKNRIEGNFQHTYIQMHKHDWVSGTRAGLKAIFQRAHARTHACTHARTHARTHTHTHTRAQIDGQTDGQTDRQTDGWVKERQGENEREEERVEQRVDERERERMGGLVKERGRER